MLEDEEEPRFTIMLGSVRSVILRYDKPWIAHKRGYICIYEPGLINKQRVILSGLEFNEFKDNCYRALPHHRAALSKAFRAFINDQQRKG